VTSSNALLTVIVLPTLALQLLAGYALLNLEGMLSSNFVVQYNSNLAGTNRVNLLSLTNLPSSRDCNVPRAHWPVSAAGAAGDSLSPVAEAQAFPAGHSLPSIQHNCIVVLTHSGGAQRNRALPQSARAFEAARPPNAPEVATGRGPSPQSGVPGSQPTAGSNARAWWISLLPRGRIWSAETLATATVLPS
jgi:hypothetical protein